MRQRQDFTGERFGRLLVIGTEILPNGKTRQICQCDCGKIIKVLTYTLKSNEKNRKTRSCGCLSADMARERAKIHASRWSKNRWENKTRACQPGDQYGELLVLAENGSLNGRRAMLCRCTCGTEKSVMAKDLLSGNTISCGCVRLARLNDGLARTNGQWEDRRPTPEWNAWHGAKDRCYNPHNRSYDDYGARGIKVCDRWKDSFEAFFQDMGPRPSPDHSLDRTDNNGPYELQNCRWATKSEQSANRRRYRTSVEEKLAAALAKRDRYIALVKEMEGKLVDIV
jgi:hypothetical protein